MLTTFLDMKQLVLDETNRPSTPLSLIGRKIMQAINWLERNHTLEYQLAFQQFTLLAQSTKAGPYELPENFKSPKLLRLISTEASGAARYKKLRRYQAPDSAAVPVGTPSRYWLDGRRYIWYDAIPHEDMDAQILYYRYTGLLADGDIHWLFDYASDLVIAKAMQLLAPYLRQPIILQLYQPALDDGVRTLLLAEEEYRNSSDEPIIMGQDAYEEEELRYGRIA